MKTEKQGKVRVVPVCADAVVAYLTLFGVAPVCDQCDATTTHEDESIECVPTPKKKLHVDDSYGLRLDAVGM